MPTDMQYDNRMMMRDQEEIARRKKAAMNPNGIPGAVVGGMVGGAAGGVAANPQVAERPYAPPLTVQEITQKFMGGPANVPTGIPQRSAQNPAPAPVAKPQTFNGQTEQQRAQARLSPQQGIQARAGVMDAQDAFKNAWDAGSEGMPIGRSRMSSADRGRLRADIGLAREDAAGYDAQQAGAPGPAMTPERTEAGRKRLQEQAARIAAERAGQPLPGSTDTWSYEAGQKALPKELQGQVFTHPQDQANYRDFSRFVGGAPSIDPATGQMTSPADREYKSVQQMREEEIMARRKAAQPIDFAPFDPAEAERNQVAATERYNDTIARGNAARAQRTQSAALDRTLADAPNREAAAKSEATINEQRRAAAAAQSATNVIPGQEAATNATNRTNALIQEMKARGIPLEEATARAQEMEKAAKANTNASTYSREREAEVGGKEADSRFKVATGKLEEKKLENYGKAGGTLDTQQRATDAINAASADKAVAGAAAEKYGSPQQIVGAAEKFMPNLKRRFGAFDPFGVNQGKPGMNITGPSIADDSNDLELLDQGVVQRLEGYAKMSPNDAATAAAEILSQMPTPGNDGLYQNAGALAPKSWARYVDKLNTIRRRLQTIASTRR